MPELCPKYNKELLVNQLIKALTQVCIKPSSTHGRPKICCLDTKIKQGCDAEDFKDCCKPGEKCVFTVSQLFCVEVPIMLDIDVDVNEAIACCGKPEFGPCKPFKDESDK